MSNKHIILIVALFFFQHTFGQSIPSDTYWIATKSSPIEKNGWITPMDGLILKFGKKQLVTNYAFSGSLKTFPLKIQGKSIFVDGNFFGKINSVNKDSLLLDFDETLRVKFVPIPEQKHKLKKLEYWEHTDWTFMSKEYTYDLKLLRLLWNKNSKSNAKIYVRQSQSSKESFKFYDLEKWNILSIKDNHILTMYFYQSNISIFRISKYVGDTVHLESLTNKGNLKARLVKNKSMPPSDLDEIVLKVKNKKWLGEELISKASSFDEGNSNEELAMSGFYAKDTTFFKKSSLIDKAYRFGFWTIQNTKYMNPTH